MSTTVEDTANVEPDSIDQETIETADPTSTDTSAAAAAAAKKNKKKEKEKAKKEKEKEKDHDKKDTGAKKKPKTTTSDLIKEAMKLRLEEEEKARKKQEEEEKRLQELEEQRLQKLKEEQERKERKKQKEKERKERLKKEGKLLTADQKQRLARQREMVEHLKQQGLVIGPSADGESTTKKPSGKMAGKQRKAKVTGGSPDEEQKFDEEFKTSTDQEENKQEASDEEDDDILESWDMVEIDSDENEAKNDKESSPTESNLDKTKSADNNKTSEIIDNKSAKINETAAQAVVPETNGTSSTVIVEKMDKIIISLNNIDAQQQMTNNNRFIMKEKESVADRIKRRNEERLNMKSDNALRSPVVCVLGHVDTGKTKILDKIRQTHVQDGEAGGITQQIGATFVPGDAIREQGKMVNNFDPNSLKLPGFLIIDTPGHESFSNLRLRGSSLCDIAILVIDIMHGLEPQTIESLNMLKKRKTPFVIALNKVDRLYEWKQLPHTDVEEALRRQKGNTKVEFKDRFNDVQAQFSEQGMNMALYWELEKKADKSDYVAVIPTSAHTGDGMGNLMCALAQICQTQYKDRLTYRENLECSVLEVKSLPGLGTTIDVILLNGRLRVGDTIIVAGMEGPIVTQIRELLMPQPMRELRVKNPYEHYKELKGAQGIKILAKDLDKALAGIPLMVAENEDEIDYFKEEVEKLLEHTLHSIKLCDKGVYVQASTLGSLEALLDFLRSQKIPYSGINIGPVHRKDVMKASAMLEHDVQWAVILAFDVKIEQDAELEAGKAGVKIFQADIIYHLQDAFVKYREELRQKKRQENAHLAIFPCKLRILSPQHVFKTRDPIVAGVSVVDGILKIGTPICVPSKECIFLGTVSSIEVSNKPVPMGVARKGQEVAIKIENTTGDAPKMYGRHFDYQDILVSRITRETIEACKQYFREDLQKSDWQLIVELKKTLDIL